MFPNFYTWRLFKTFHKFHAPFPEQVQKGLTQNLARSGNGQLEVLCSFLLPLNNSGVSWFNGTFASFLTKP
jgi:hypothetical protein